MIVKEIVHKGIPCLKLGNGKKSNYVPMEFCVLDEDRRFRKEQLGREAARQLKDLCLLPPDFRRNEMFCMMREEYGTGSQLEVIQNFEVGVGMNMTTVDGRVMPPPKLKLGGSGGKTITTTINRLKCYWNLLQRKTLVDDKSLERWALIDFSSGDRRNRLNVNPFTGKLMNRCFKR
ncbi:hypothetical protein L6452_13438 [Arctium lappa]|uniref:Uncharacterized protein n=1 Tax=Arctium lappa TaxID=4217 RepID=A0ACB9CI50_ARCLA|nr:hypothetical protein L6452_13438 [Arctium lappa]